MLMAILLIEAGSVRPAGSGVMRPICFVLALELYRLLMNEVK